MMHRSKDIKDPIEVYFDDRIGIIEVEDHPPDEKKKKPLKLAKGPESNGIHQFDILATIEARNEQEARTGSLIQEFETKIKDFFDYVQNTDEGERLIVKINSHVSEAEIGSLVVPVK